MVDEDQLARFARHLAGDRWLGVLITTGGTTPDPQVAVVNAAVVGHPIDGTDVVALVARRGAKLVNLRRNRRATLVARHGWEWAAVRGPVELCGPDDPLPGVDAEHRRLLLRTIYLAAGGHHPDLDAYDRVMAGERRCAVLISPEHIWTNPPGSEHREPEER